MQIRSIAFAAAALVAAQAQAITLPAGTKTLYVSGSSALTPVIKAIFGTNCVGGSTGVTTYTNAAADQLLYTCTVSKTTNFAKTINGGVAPSTDLSVAVFKRDAGGSIQGVNPVATNTAIAFLDEASVSVAGANASATTKNVVPQLGAADVEPALLQEALNLPAGTTALTPAQLSNLNTTTALLATFGIAVNNNLYTALQAAQGTSGVPSIPTNFIISLVNKSGVFQSADKTWGNLLNSTNLGQVNVCRRSKGSGTQAGANLLFTPYNESPVVAGDTDSPAGDGGILYVNEAGSTGGVKTCLNSLDTAASTAYGIGYIGYENKPGSTDTWKFVNLDGVSPDIANAKAGLYSYAFENTFNTNKSLSGNALAFANAIITEAANPAVIGNLSAALQTAVAPVSSSQATRAGNSRNPLKVVK
jgi:hypothetical protein